MPENILLQCYIEKYFVHSSTVLRTRNFSADNLVMFGEGQTSQVHLRQVVVNFVQTSQEVPLINPEMEN